MDCAANWTWQSRETGSLIQSHLMTREKICRYRRPLLKTQLKICVKPIFKDRRGFETKATKKSAKK